MMANEMVKSQGDKVQAIEKTLLGTLPSLTQLMPSGILTKPDLFVRCVVIAMRQTPGLGECDPLSIVLSTAQACALGLPPNTSLGLSYLVPFKGKCQLIPGYKGLIRLAENSGAVKSITARVVFNFDEYAVEFGLDEKLYHKPGDGERTDQNVVGAYAIATLADGEKKFEWMYKREIDAIKARSNSGEKGPWVTDYAEMCKKTAIRRLCKTLPLSEEKETHRHLGRALEIQAASEVGDDPFAFLELPEDAGVSVKPKTLAERASQ
jgi:recombination protein RecT